MTNCTSGYNGRGTGTRLYLILPRQSPPSIQLMLFIIDIFYCFNKHPHTLIQAT